MGNCSSLKGTYGECPNSVRVLTDSGGILQFKGPKLASEILAEFPGYGIFQQCKASAPLPEEEPLTSGQFYLLPLKPKEEVPSDNGVSVQVQEMGVDEKMECVDEEAEPVKKSFRGASDYVENLANGSGGGLEVLPCGGDGVWKVKLVINTKQLEEILSEGNTLALIETMRMAATTNSTPKLQSKGLWGSGGGGWNWKPIFSNMFKAPMAITAPVVVTGHSGI